MHIDQDRGTRKHSDLSTNMAERTAAAKPDRPLRAGCERGPGNPTIAALAGAAIGSSLAAYSGNSRGDDGADSSRINRSASLSANTISEAEASRFLAQASMGATRDQISRVQALGYSGWLDEQLNLPQGDNRWDWLMNHGFSEATYKNTESGFDAVTWQKLISSSDTLRQRIALALSEIMVVGIDGLVGGWRSFTAAAYLDLLEDHAFGNYRTLLEAISHSPAMGEWLTFRGNVKANPVTGSQPDENYAREVMQLFTIGLVKLNPNGTPILKNGVPTYTYTQKDVTGLARVFTGWDWDFAGANTDTPDFQRRPMVMYASRHETGAKSFLGKTIPAGTDGVTSLRIALDTIFGHPNVAPFVGRQLIQRLVTSNPSSAYVGRVAAVFNNDGTGVKGNLTAVIRAILLDDEARNAANPTTPAFGKLREPILRFTAWARAFNASSASEAWGIGNTSDPATRLGQSPLRSPTVFNFFRPGYVPPNSNIAAAELVGPEFQIVNESSVVGYVNFMQRAVSGRVGDVIADYGTLLPLADNSQALLDELNAVIAAGELSSSTLSAMWSGLDTMPRGTDLARRNRIYAALTMVFAAPEFIVQK
jgi:uncharacterized protein (DUF1800 family)